MNSINCASFSWFINLKQELVSALDVDVAHFRNDYLPDEIFH